MEKQPNVGSDPEMMISGKMSNLIKKPYRDPNGINGNGINTVKQGSSNLMMTGGRAQNGDESITRGFYHFGEPVVYRYVKWY